MATLNTLRTRGGVIVSIVIGIALLAFLLGDLSSAGNMMNARKMRVGEIDGNKIGYLEYTEQVDYLTGIQQTMTGKDALSSEEQMQVQNFAWDSTSTCLHPDSRMRVFSCRRTSRSTWSTATTFRR